MSDNPLRYRHYVYTLAYPDGRVFYVGKGKGSRMDRHEQEARSGVQSPKCDIIRAIWEQGGEVVKAKVASFPTDEEALRYENYLISTLPDLANSANGEGRFGEVTISLEDQREFGASIRRADEHGNEYWSARDMANFLGYRNWQPFRLLIERVERMFVTVGMDVTPHFQHTDMYVSLTGDTKRQIEDVHLSRRGFLIVLQNADSTKALVAYGKSYVARQVTLTAGADAPLSTGRNTTIVAHMPRQKSGLLREEEARARILADGQLGLWDDIADQD